VTVILIALYIHEWGFTPTKKEDGSYTYSSKARGVIGVRSLPLLRSRHERPLPLLSLVISTYV